MILAYSKLSFSQVFKLYTALQQYFQNGEKKTVEDADMDREDGERQMEKEELDVSVREEESQGQVLQSSSYGDLKDADPGCQSLGIGLRGLSQDFCFALSLQSFTACPISNAPFPPEAILLLY